MYEPIRTSHRLGGQWKRYLVFAHVEARHHHNRIARFQPCRPKRDRFRLDATELRQGPRQQAKTERCIGSIYADSQADAMRLARRALAAVSDIGRVRRLSKLTALPPTQAELQVWRHEIRNGSVRPTCGPLVDSEGYAIQCFIPRS